jgi:hypothetical protein
LQYRISNGAVLSDLAEIVKIVLRESQIYDFVSDTAICESHLSEEGQGKYTWFEVLAGSFQGFKKIVLPLRLSPRMVSQNFSSHTVTFNIAGGIHKFICVAVVDAH